LMCAKRWSTETTVPPRHSVSITSCMITSVLSLTLPQR
jgi:hypothetical protein